MPASRSRTDRWRECLEQIRERAGGLELSLAAPEHAGVDLVWRVRLFQIHEDRLLVEAPAAAGEGFEFPSETPLVAAMSIGQNRWMFHTTVLGRGVRGGTMELSAPEGVERCQRRSFHRISTAELRLPGVVCWPVLDPASLPIAQAASRGLAQSPADHVLKPGSGDQARLNLPAVGVPFEATLMNLGGGGLGMQVGPDQSGGVEALRTYWLHLDLTPDVPGPIGVAGKLVHTHLDHMQNLYCGLSFEFCGDDRHRRFVVERLVAYIKARRERCAAA